jgi:hypothetical protein
MFASYFTAVDRNPVVKVQLDAALLTFIPQIIGASSDGKAKALGTMFASYFTAVGRNPDAKVQLDDALETFITQIQ